MRRYRDDLRACLAVLGSVLVLGTPAGLVWEAVSPKVQVIARDGGVFYANPEGSAPIAADGYFALVGVVAGVICGFVIFFRARRHGVGAVIGLVAGGVLASLVAWRLGHLLGPGELAESAKSAKDGVPFSGPLELRAYGVLLMWPLASTTVFLALTAGHDSQERLEARRAEERAGIPGERVAPEDMIRPERPWESGHAHPQRYPQGHPHTLPAPDTGSAAGPRPGATPGGRWLPTEHE